MRSAILFSVFLLSGCGSSNQASPTSPSSAPAGGSCAVETGGPVIGFTYMNGERPAGIGGPIMDGDYDLVQIVAFSNSGKRWTTDRDVFRVAMRVRTKERSPNHTAGEITMKFEQPPTAKCSSGSFALIQNQFRTTDARGGPVEEHDYTASAPGQIELHYTDSAKWIFRKRP